MHGREDLHSSFKSLVIFDYGVVTLVKVIKTPYGHMKGVHRVRLGFIAVCYTSDGREQCKWVSLFRHLFVVLLYFKLRFQTVTTLSPHEHV